jgi:hypothetical protein
MAQQISKRVLMDMIRQAIADEQDKANRKSQNQIFTDDGSRQKYVLKKELSDMRSKVRLEIADLDEKLRKLRYTKQELEDLINTARRAIKRLEQLKQIRY